MGQQDLRFLEEFAFFIIDQPPQKIIFISLKYKGDLK